MKLIAELLNMQDPAKPHTLLTRSIVSLIIVGTSLVYTGFFGVIGAVAVYLIGVELIGAHLRWVWAPIALALVAGLRNSLVLLVDYWRNYGHG